MKLPRFKIIHWHLVFFKYKHPRKIEVKIFPRLPKKSCEGCKHLDFYNDGSAFCAKGINHACISSGFSMKEEGVRTI